MERRHCGQAGAITLVFLAAWLLWQSPPAHLPTSDLFTHLCVARHLADGDGFLNDIVYPLSLAFPFAAHVPQPLIHRGPLYAMLLVGTIWTGGHDPGAALAGVWWLHVGLLGWIVVLALRHLLRLGLAEAILAWLLLFGSSRLLAMSIGWGQIEIVAAALLTLLWLRWRQRREAIRNGRRGVFDAPEPIRLGTAALDGALAAALTLLRPDLFWIPMLWWSAGRRSAGRRATAVAAIVWLALLTPWIARNTALTGQPFFSLQAYGEQLKQTADWPEYTIYRSLSPEPFLTTLQERPGLVLRKTAAGLRFYLTHLGHWLPWPVLAVWVALIFKHRGPFRRRGQGRRRRFTGLETLLLTLGLLMVQYAPLSHTLRHLVILLPVVSLEICLAAAVWLSERRPRWRASGRAVLLGVAALGCIWALPARLPDWQKAAEAASRAAAPIAKAASELELQPAGPIFTDTAALCWWSGRPGVWSPLDGEVEARIRRLVPEMATAPVIRVLPDLD
jgi:hypothetical protein